MSKITQYSEMADITPRARYHTHMSSLLNRNDNDGNYQQKPFGKAVRKLRRRRGWTQTDLAVLMGVAGPSTVAGWERRFAPHPDDYLMERLANVLQVSVDDLAAGIVRSEQVESLAMDEQIEALASKRMPPANLKWFLGLWKAAETWPSEERAALDIVVEGIDAALRAKREEEEGRAKED